uniref:INO80 complex subunit C n=1 Tax=Iconisemion striatum TaxID=60296 RepID=A0A1A7YLC4_9TELE
MASQLPITVKTQPPAANVAAFRPKKRPCSPAASGGQQAAGGSTSSGVKKKKGPLVATPTTQIQITAVETMAEMKAVGSVDSGPVSSESTAKPPPFKDHTFMHSGIGGAAAGKKNRTWKNLKQILALERTLPWKLSDPNCEFLLLLFT